jgi:hypothetical protein
MKASRALDFPSAKCTDQINSWDFSEIVPGDGQSETADFFPESQTPLI